jgi:integrase
MSAQQSKSYPKGMVLFFLGIRKKLGLPTSYKFYRWKHTGAMMANNSGMTVKDIQMQMRHHSLDETDKYLKKMKAVDSDYLKNDFPDL